MRTREPTVDLPDDQIPIAKKVKRDDRRDDQECCSICQRAKPADDLRADLSEHLGGSSQRIFQEFLYSSLIIRLQVGEAIQQGARFRFDPRGQIRQLRCKLHQLFVQHRHQYREKKDDQQKEAGCDERSRDCTRAPHLLEPVAHGVKKIGDRQSNEKRQENRSEQKDGTDKDRECGNPRKTPLGRCHWLFSPTIAWPPLDAHAPIQRAR